MLSLDDTSAMKQIRAAGLYITCLKIIKLVIGNKSKVPKICTRSEEVRLQTSCLSCVTSLCLWRGVGGGSGLYITYFRLIGN
jgi:hypothetical protein